MQTLIYGLTDKTGLIRYVGKTCKTMNKRMSVHIASAKKSGGTHVKHWIAKLLSDGCKPIPIILETVDDDGCAAERKWIAYGREQGWKLTNHTDGGEGSPGRIGYWKGKKRSPETNAKVLAYWTDEKRKERSEQYIGRTTPDDIKNKIRASLEGKSKTDEHRRKLSERAKEQWRKNKELFGEVGLKPYN